MANHYIEFSEMISSITPDEEYWLRAELEVDIHAMTDVEMLNWVECRVSPFGPIDTEEIWPAFQWSFIPDKSGNKYCIIYAEEYGFMDHVVNLVQRFFVKFRPNEIFILHWAEYCNKPRPGEFSGGAWVISKDRAEYMNAHQWAEAKVKAWEKIE